MTNLASARVVEVPAVTTRTTCRLCGQRQLSRVWSFGPTPLANAYLDPRDAARQQPEVFAPLDVYFCTDCQLVQLLDVVNPELLFSHYLYVSSTSPSFVQHFVDYAAELITRWQLTAADLVVDVGSNDGALLRPLQNAGVRTLGIDPAANIAAQATASGIETWPEFFTAAAAGRIISAKGQARVITANNVFAHTDDIHGFVDAVDKLLTTDGVFVFEVQYLGDLVAKNLFDIVYHEHVNYYHLTPLVSYFTRRGLMVFDVERVPVHGGSIRVFVGRTSGPHQPNYRVKALLTEEAAAGLNDTAVYRAFAKRIVENGQKLKTMLTELRRAGKRVAGFGAPAKATTLMYAYGLTAAELEYIVDDAPLKQGRLMPGTHIPIYPAAAIYSDQPPVGSSVARRSRPDYCVILAWNFADAIMANHRRFTNQGGRWIIPVPEPRVV